MKISNVAQMRALDRTAVEQYGIAEEILMENAGEATYHLILQEIGVAGKKFAVFCGDGNNGGDGLVIARKLHSSGGIVTIILVGEPGKYQGAARCNYDIIKRLQVPIHVIDRVESLQSVVYHADVLIDAIFGTGLTREVTGRFREIIKLVNTSGKTVVSVDIPSGVNGDTGAIMGIAVKADYTVTFGLPKIGTMLFPGYAQCGELSVTHISFPPALYNSDHLTVAVNIPDPLPLRLPDGHKGTFGDVLFIAGASSYFGAPLFAAFSFLKAGGGYSRLATPKSMIPFLATRGSEIVFVPQQETATGSIALSNKTNLLNLAEKVDMVVLGPGMSLDPETQQLARELAQHIAKPLLIDGDGITALCADRELIKARTGATILTPHVGEMARLVQRSIADVVEYKIPLLQETANTLHAMIVLKGAHSLIGVPDGRVFVNLTGNAGMATAGSGDVLNGTIAAMFTLGLPLEEAVKKGVFMHGLAGDCASRQIGQDGMTAHDILDSLPRAMRLDRDGLPPDLCQAYFGPQVL